MLKLKLHYFSHLMRRADSLEKTPMLGKIERRREKGQQRTIQLDGITDSIDMSLCKLQEMVKDRKAWHAVVHGVAKSWTRLSDWTEQAKPNLHLSASGENPIRTSEAQSDLLLERARSVGIDLFVMPAPPPYSQPAPSNWQVYAETPWAGLKCSLLEMMEIKQDLKAMHFLLGTLIWINCSGFSAVRGCEG